MTTELDRIRRGPDPSEVPSGMGTVRFAAKCRGNATQVLKTCRAALAAAVELSTQNCFDETVWAASLPEAFVKASPPFPTVEEMEAYNRLTLDERVEVDRRAGWPLRAFMNSFRVDLDMRYWSWWDAVILDENRIAVAVDVSEWPFPWESLRWLFRGSGAIDLIPEQELV